MSTTHVDSLLTCSVPLFCSDGITQHLINGGIARLEEVQGADGILEDLYIWVHALFIFV
jgi:hypothetical protein